MKRLLSIIALILAVVSISAQEVYLGDAFKDNVIDGKDVTEVVKAIMKSSNLSENYSEENADANKDSKVNVADIVSIVNMIKSGNGEGYIVTPVETKSVTLNATVTLNDRAKVWFVGGKGKKMFAEGEKLALVYKSGTTSKLVKKEITLSSENLGKNGGSASFSEEITSYDPDYGLELYYPASAVSIVYDKVKKSPDMLNLQYGSAADVYENSIFFMSKIDDSNTVDNTLDVDVKLGYQFTLLRLLLLDENQSNITSNISRLTLELSSPDGEKNTYQVQCGTGNTDIYVALPPVETTDRIKISAYNGTDNYIQNIVNKQYLKDMSYGIYMRMGRRRDLSHAEGIIIANDGDVLTGTLPAESFIRLQTDATVVLDNLNITNNENQVLNYPGIVGYGIGSYTIILEGTNVVRGCNKQTPGIIVNGTLAICGSGSLDVCNGTSEPYYPTSNGGSPGLGASRLEIYSGTITAASTSIYPGLRGNIYIYGGNITSIGAPGAAGIGGYEGEKYGPMVTIMGGTVTAVGGAGGAAIGSGRNGSCDNITISSPTKKVTLISGGDGAELIGKGSGEATCGTVTIDGVANATTESKFENFVWVREGSTWSLVHK